MWCCILLFGPCNFTNLKYLELYKIESTKIYVLMNLHNLYCQTTWTRSCCHFHNCTVWISAQSSSQKCHKQKSAVLIKPNLSQKICFCKSSGLFYQVLWISGNLPAKPNLRKNQNGTHPKSLPNWVAKAAKPNLSQNIWNCKSSRLFYQVLWIFRNLPAKPNLRKNQNGTHPKSLPN